MDDANDQPQPADESTPEVFRGVWQDGKLIHDEAANIAPLTPETRIFLQGLCAVTCSFETRPATPEEQERTGSSFVVFNFETRVTTPGCRHRICDHNCDLCVWEKPVLCPQCGAPTHVAR